MARRNVIEYLLKVNDQGSKELKKIEGNVKSVGKELLRLSGFLGAGWGVKEIVDLADTFRMYENRIKLVTSSTEELRAVQEQLIDISADTRSSYEATANLYARVARSSRELGLSQQELLDFTKTVQQSIRISGSTAAEASAGVIQFGQALASSRLSGDELRSVLEQMPRLAQAIAEGMGVGIGALREMGEEGELTTDRVLDALRKSAPQIAKEFGQLKPLVSEAFVVLKSSIMTTIGVMDRAGGASAHLAQALLDVSTQIRLFGDAVTGNLTIEKLEDMGTETKALAIAAMTLAFALGAVKDALDVGATAGGSWFTNFLSRGSEALDRWRGDEAGLWEAFGDAVRISTEDATTATSESFEKNIDQMTDDMEFFILRWRAMMGDVQAQKILDLSGKTVGFKGPNRKELDAINDAKGKLEKMNGQLRLQVQAYTDAVQSGSDYQSMLRAVQVNALAAASGEKELAADVLAMMGYLNDLEQQYQTVINKKKAFSDITDFQTATLNEMDALKVAIETGADYNQVLEEQRLRALAAAAGLDEYAEYGDVLVDVYRNLLARRNELADKQVIENLEKEYQLIGLTNKERFVQQQLQQLSVDATREQIIATRELAEELYDRQKDWEENMKFMENLARRAAENIQDAFADFLFDPFDKGVKGMLKAFLEAIRRMVAELIAADFAKKVKGWWDKAMSFASGGASVQQISEIPLPGVKRQGGGPVVAGTPVLVGEAGPEIFIPEGGGRVLNNSATRASLGQAAPTFITNIDARGADPGLIARLPDYMEARDKKLMLAVKRYLETGMMPI